MKRIFTPGLVILLVAGLLAVVTAPAAAQTVLYSIENFSSDILLRLHRIDPATGATLVSVPIVVPGKTIVSINGLAAHPTTGQLFAVFTFEGQQSQRFLVTLDPTTGAGAIVGNLGDRFASLAFAADGTLFGVTGDGANTPDTLFTINLSTGQTTVFLALGNGGAGEAIAFDPVDGRLYHASGNGVRNVDQIFESVNLQAKATSPIPLSGLEVGEVTALAYSQAFFVGADLDGTFFMVTPAGVVSQIGVLDHISKGLAFAPTPPPTVLVAAILPSSRAVDVNTPATAFATILNAGSNTAFQTGIGLAASIPAALTYNATSCATNAVIGADNVPVNIESGQQACYVIALAPFATFPPTEVAFSFVAINTPVVSTLTGINTLLMSASDTKGPDIVALAATTGGNGVVVIPGTNGIGAFAVASVNVGAGGLVTVSGNTGGTALPVQIKVCETDPGNGQCKQPLAASVTLQIDAGKTPTFGIFVFGSGNVPFDPATNRVFVEFSAGGQVVGRTSVAVRTN